MADDIWSGKESFMQGERKSIKLTKQHYIIIGVIAAAVVLSFLFIERDEAESPLVGAVVAVDDLAEYRNMTAEELRNKLFDVKVRPIKEININSGAYYFEPSKINVDYDDRVILNITSKDINYTLRITSLSISKLIKEKSNEIIEFIAVKNGTFIMKALEYDQMKAEIIIDGPETLEG